MNQILVINSDFPLSLAYIQQPDPEDMLKRDSLPTPEYFGKKNTYLVVFKNLHFFGILSQKLEMIPILPCVQVFV